MGRVAAAAAGTLPPQRRRAPACTARTTAGAVGTVGMQPAEDCQSRMLVGLPHAAFDTGERGETHAQMLAQRSQAPPLLATFHDQRMAQGHRAPPPAPREAVRRGSRVRRGIGSAAGGGAAVAPAPAVLPCPVGRSRASTRPPAPGAWSSTSRRPLARYAMSSVWPSVVVTLNISPGARRTPRKMPTMLPFCPIPGALRVQGSASPTPAVLLPVPRRRARAAVSPPTRGRPGGAT